MNKKTILALIFITFLGLFLHFYKLDQTPRCLNADEAAFAYNAYSILKTGKDEYGTLLPLRLKSFGDYKMPLISYLTIPFIAIFGLNDWSIKLQNAFILLLFPTLLYFFVYRLFKNKSVALLTPLVFVCSWGIQSMGRQLHEALLTSFLITATAYFFVLAKDEKGIKYKVLFTLANFLSLFSYQSSRIFGVFFLALTFFYTIKKKFNWKFFLIFLATLGIFGISDIVYKPKRVTNLLFFNKAVFTDQINELRGEGGSKFIYNKFSIGIRDLVFEHFKYFSPQFLVTNGDANLRFGYVGLSPITLIEYLFFFIGLYYLFKNKEKFRFYIVAFFLISPLSGSLSWAGLSLTRSFFIIVPTLIIASYGATNFIKSLQKKYQAISVAIIFFAYLTLVFYNWDFYINHYPKKAMTIQSWQCGYKELVKYVENNYDKYDRFYITKEDGPPYIFFLYYLKYSPQKYQPQANLSAPDEYGFGQVEKFDKFVFNLDTEKKQKNIVVVGRPLETNNNENTEIIKTDTEEMFWINEIR